MTSEKRDSIMDISFAQQEPGAFAAMYPNAGIRHAVVRAPAHSLAALAYLPPGKSHAKGHVTRR